MENDNSLKTWVSEATSPAGLVEKLEEFPFSSSTERVDFADEVLARVHRKPFYLNPCQKHSRPFSTQHKLSAALQHYRDVISAWDEEFTKDPSSEEKKQKALQDYQIEKATLNDELLNFKEKSASEKLQLLEKIKFTPLFSVRSRLVEAVQNHQILLIHGETGAGKSTFIPQILLEAGITETTGKKIACTLPSRVAARSVAARVCQQMSVQWRHEFKLGEGIGYTIHFEDCTCENTVMKFMTDGILLREFLVEPDFSRYSVLIVDEAHQRKLSTDNHPFDLFGLLKEIARLRPDLKLLFMSNSSDELCKLSYYFDDCNIFWIPFARPRFEV